MSTMRVGILGAGWIAHKMAEAIAPLKDVEVVAVASRSAKKAHDFAQQYAIVRDYDNYESLVQDPQIDLIYIATPHSHHYPHARLALEHGKAVLVEKAFTANSQEAEALITLAREKQVLLVEAIWTRFMPLSRTISELLQKEIIGQPRLLSASLCYPLEDKERILRPELCGGALLDLGVYVLNFARMYFGNDIIKTVSNCHLSETGVDMMESISLSYADGKMANLQAGAMTYNDRHGVISGTEGYILVDNVNCPESIEVWRNYALVEHITRPQDMINGYEYEVLECKRCLDMGIIESPYMPHSESLSIMSQMDQLRKEWGVTYPMD